MKYIFKILFGVAVTTSTSKNILWNHFFIHMRSLFNYNGSTRMMSKREERSFLSYLHKGLVLDGQSRRLSPKESFNHMGILARTGGGKTTSYIIPNILKLAETKNSMVITDLSGELYEKTSGYLKKKEFKVYVLDPEDLNNSIGYNPLYYVKNSLDIDEVSEILIRSANPGAIRAEDKLWLDGAKSLLAILIKLLISTHNHKVVNLANLKYLLNNIKTTYKDPETGEINYKLDDVIYKYCDKKTFSEWQGFMSGNEKSIDSFISTANVSLNAVAVNDNLSIITANHNINFENFRKEKSVVYIKVPQQKQEQYSFLLNLFYKQFFNVMMERLPSKTDLPVYCLLDEFGNMVIPSFSSIITTIRKYKVSISIVVQTLKQLESKYGKNEAYTIINGGITGKIFFSGADPEITEMVSKMIGDQHITKLDEFGNPHHVKEPILSSSQVRTMGDEEVILIYANKLPLKMSVKPYYKDFVLNSYTKISPATKESYFEVSEIEYLDLDPEIEYE